MVVGCGAVRWGAVVRDGVVIAGVVVSCASVVVGCGRVVGFIVVAACTAVV